MTTRYSTTEWNNKKVIFGETKIDEKKSQDFLEEISKNQKFPKKILRFFRQNFCRRKLFQIIFFLKNAKLSLLL